MRIRNIGYVGILVAAMLLSFACTSPPALKKVSISTSVTPIPPEPIRVEKPVNVSFSTYSKDWPEGWQWIDPDEKENPTPHDVKLGVLRIRIPKNKDLIGENRTAPRYLKAIAGDFQIETRVKFLPKENYQGAGLLIYQNENNYLRFERAYGGLGGGGEGIRLDVRTDKGYTPITTPNEIQYDAETVDLRIVRSGQLITAYWRLNEDAEWREAGEYLSDFPETVMAGVVAANTAREVKAEFAFIRLLPSPGK